MRNLANRPLKSGESGALNYRRINATERAAIDAGNQASQTRYQTARAPFRPMERMFPFKLYQVPRAWRDRAAVPATDWRTFIVRSGLVLESSATNTDAVADPYSELYPDSLVNEVIVPDNIEKFWFWLEIGETDGVTTAVVRFSDDPTAESYDDPEATEEADQSWATDNPWDGFPRPDAGHIPIGWVDTKNKRTSRRAIVRQILTADVMFLGSFCP